MKIDYIEGVFIEECKSRFLCIVDIAGVRELCYVASSSKLEQFITLSNRKVLLKKNTSKNTKTKYSLYAVEATEGYILLNLGYVNVLLEKMLIEEGVAAEQITREKHLVNMKTDLYVDGQCKQVYEAKALLSENNTVIFPSVTVFRVETQLKELISLLKEGYQVIYCLFLLSEHILNIKPNPNEKNILRLLKRGLKNGMKLQVYTVKWEADDFVSERAIVSELAFIDRLLLGSKGKVK